MMRLIDANALYEKVDKPPMRGFVHVSDIDTMPIINTESLRSHGKWYDKAPIIWHETSNIPVVQCSECGITFCDIINNHHYMYRYCPHCGARMDKEENNDTE